MEKSNRAYESPEIEIIAFGDEDVITASGDQAGHSSANGAMMPRIY